MSLSTLLPRITHIKFYFIKDPTIRLKFQVISKYLELILLKLPGLFNSLENDYMKIIIIIIKYYNLL